jgi:alpha-L-fucosidase
MRLRLTSLGIVLVTTALAAAPQQADKPANLWTGAAEADTTPPARTETPAERDARMQWWREARFGLFIHWGVYAVPAGSYGGKDTYGEWIMHEGKIPVAEYRRFATRFNPVKYDPAAWVRMAKDAGMRYIVITSKHHDGFALFPSDASTWDVADATPYKKDLLAPLVEEAHKAGLKIGFYYSQAQDWNNRGGAKSGFDEGGGWDQAQKGSFDAYLKYVAEPQVREILTRYPIDILWWDTPTWMNARRTAPLAAMTSLRPGLVTNNRLGPGFGGDTATPEQFIPATGLPGDWETCMTTNDHWGYNAADRNWKSSQDLVRKLAEIASKGGNFLLNVGPNADGEFPAEAAGRLRDVGAWLKVNGDAIYGTTAGPFAHVSWGVATRRANRLYLHVFAWPKDGELRVPIASAVGRASLLATPDRVLPVRREAQRVVVTLPSAAPDPVDTVVVLELGTEPVVLPLPTAGKPVTASSTGAGSAPMNVNDGTQAVVWTAADAASPAWVEYDLGAPVAIGGFSFDEPDVWPRLAQAFRLEAAENGTWKAVASGSTIGHGYAGDFTPVTAQRFRLTIERKDGAPAVAEWQLYRPE